MGAARERLSAFLARVEADPTGGLKAATVFVACALASLLLWYPLGLPSELVRNVIAQPAAICSFGSGSADIFAAAAAAGTPRMYLCSFGVAVLTMAGPIALLVAAFLLRRTIAGLVRRWIGLVPEGLRFLVAPLLSSLLFGLAWAGSHYTTAWSVGLLPQTLFPGVIGLFTFTVARWGSVIQRRLVAFFDLRDRFPMKVRIGVALLVPIVISLVLTAENRVSFNAVKEQLIVLIGLTSGFLALAPRHGDVLAGVSRQVATVSEQVNAEARQRIAAARAARQ